MLDVNVWGANDSAIESMIAELVEMIHGKFMAHKPIEVNIHIDDFECDGMCECVDEQEYDIELKASLSDYDLLIAVAHEMVHVKQYALGQLRQLVRKPMYRWKKELFPLDTPYDDQPWEKEAYSLEKILVEEYLQSQNI